jgi:hypothetical protein
MIIRKYNYTPSFRITWMIVTVIFLFEILFFKIPNGFFSRPINNILLVSCSFFLIKHYTSPLPKVCTKGNQLKTLLLGFFFLVILCVAKSVIGGFLYTIIPIIAIIFLIIYRKFLTRRHFILAVIITVLSVLTAYLGEWNGISKEKWALLQFILVFPGFLAGWALLNGSGYSYLGVGRSIFVTESFVKALSMFFEGMFLSLPWAFGKILMGSTPEFTWVNDWWNIFASFNIGVSGEGWGRALWVPIIFFILSRFSNTGNIFRASTLIVAYWATYLSLSSTAFNIFIQTPIAVVLFAMPIATLMFSKNLETALGFHFSIQFFKLLAAFMINNGIILSG